MAASGTESTTGNTAGATSEKTAHALLKTGPADGTTTRATPAARMAKLARLARARGFVWTAFYNLYAAAVIEGDKEAGFQLADVLIALRPTQVLAEVDEAFQLALCTPWTRPASLTRAIVDYLLLDPRIEQITEEVNLSTDDLDIAAGLLARNELFATLLQTSVANDLRLERMLIALREHLLAVAPSTPGALRLAALLATQANLVEYLWPYTTGPISAQTTHDRPLPPVTSARALLNSMFRPPNGAEINAIELIAADPAISCLLERVRDEPILHTRCRDELERTASCLGTSAVDRRDGLRSGARWVKEPFAPRKVPLAVQRRLRARRFDAGDVLVAGCGTGQELFAVRATYPNAHVTALEASADKLAHAARKCAEAGLSSIELLPGSLLDVAPLGWTFDLIECPGLQRHVPDADFGCEALARCSRSGSLLRLAVYGDATCRLVSALRNSAQLCGISHALGDLQRFRAELLEGQHGALPPALLRSPEFHTASGLRDLLFADGEVALGTSAWIAMLHVHGFDFICEEVNGELVRAARAAGFPGAPLWSVRDTKRFEREQPFAFGGTQFLWFERRARPRR